MYSIPDMEKQTNKKENKSDKKPPKKNTKTKQTQTAIGIFDVVDHAFSILCFLNIQRFTIVHCHFYVSRSV